MAMFPQFEAAPGAQPASGSSSLLSFKAGKMDLSDKGGDKFHITPDLRKGTVSLFKGPDDQLMHFSWKERPSGRVVDDMIILPEEAVYKKIDTGREGERVYLMEIAGNRRFFYWMQDKDSDKDEENMKKVNELTNSPPADDAPAARGVGGSPDMMDLLGSMGAGAQTSSLGAPGGSGAPGSLTNEQGLNIQNLQSILENMGFSSQEQAQASAGASSLSSTSATSPPIPGSSISATAPAVLATPASATPTPQGISGGDGTGGGLTAADLQRAMMRVSGMAAQRQQPPTSLNDVVNAREIEATGILDDPQVQEVLLPLMPDGQQTEHELRETIRSPQLQQALASLSQALQSDNFNNIMSSFELDPSNARSAEAMVKGDPVDAFLQALIHAAEVKRQREAVEGAPADGAGEGEGGGAKDSEG